MAKDAALDMRLDDLSDAEIERIEAMVFCMGGPPCSLSTVLVSRACSQRRTTHMTEGLEPAAAA